MKIEHILCLTKLPQAIEQINWTNNYVEFYSWYKKEQLKPNEYTVAIFRVKPKAK